MYKAMVIRLFPLKVQVGLLWQNAGTARWVWNWGLQVQRDSYAESKRLLSVYELKRKFTELRNSEGFKWLKEVSRQVEANALIDLNMAYRNFLRRLKAGKTGGMPKFKAKGKCTPSFCTRSGKVKADEHNRIYLEKIGWVRFKAKCNLEGLKFYNARVKFECGRWLLKCAVEVQPEKPGMTLRSVNMGIDVGVKSLAVVSCGGRKRVFRNINRNHRMKRLTRQLKHHQRILSRKEKGSENYLKEKYRVQDIYGRIRRKRHEYVRQTAREIVSMRPQAIVMEDLNIQGMMKNSHIARAVAEQNLHLLRRLIELKASEAGIRVVFAGRFFPSSKKCSGCGHVRKELKLSERIFRCPECGKVIDRDFNAALNLERLAE
ncbi:MAG: transposase [Synergistaceae bacterium]|nr:transposase [Synergistaceae bacterium]